MDVIAQCFDNLVWFICLDVVHGNTGVSRNALDKSCYSGFSCLVCSIFVDLQVIPIESHFYLP